MLKVLSALEPSVDLAVMHTTMMSASITAYLTAVGPASFLRKLVTVWYDVRIGVSESGWGKVAEDHAMGRYWYQP
jgi:hypothetical protein